MRICLITEVYPALEQFDAASIYITKLAQGLMALKGPNGSDENANQITVICAQSNAGAADQNGIRVIEVPQSKRFSSLQLTPVVMPEATQFARAQIDYWHALASVLKESQFDVIETTYNLGATLLSAITREIMATTRSSGVRVLGS